MSVCVWGGRIQYSGFLLPGDILAVDFTGYACVAFGGGPSVNRQNPSEPLGVSLASDNFAIQESPHSWYLQPFGFGQRTPRGASSFFFFLSGMKFYPHLKDTGSSDDDCICRSSEVDSGPAEADISSSWTWAHSHGTNLSNTQQAAAAWATLGV